MEARKSAGPAAPAQNYEDFDPSYDQVHEPEVDTLLLYLQGFTKDQIRVQLTGSRILKISGQRQVEGHKWIRFFKQFPVSSNCDTNRITAKFEAGVLYITQPKLIIPAEKPPAESFPQKPAEPTEQKTEEAEPSKKGEDAASRAEPSEPTKPERASDEKGENGASRTEPVEQTKLDNASVKKPMDEGSGPGHDKRVVAEKSDGAKSGVGNAAKMEGYSDNAPAAQLKRSRKVMNVALVILLVAGVGLYVNNKIRSSSTEAGEL